MELITETYIFSSLVKTTDDLAASGRSYTIEISSLVENADELIDTSYHLSTTSGTSLIETENLQTEGSSVVELQNLQIYPTIRT